MYLTVLLTMSRDFGLIANSKSTRRSGGNVSSCCLDLGPIDDLNLRFCILRGGSLCCQRWTIPSSKGGVLSHFTHTGYITILWQENRRVPGFFLWLERFSWRYGHGTCLFGGCCLMKGPLLVDRDSGRSEYEPLTQVWYRALEMYCKYLNMV